MKRPRPLPLHRQYRLSYRGLAEGLGQEMVRLQPNGDWGWGAAGENVMGSVFFIGIINGFWRKNSIFASL